MDEPQPTGSLQARSERLADSTFLGGPAADFERVGRLSFQVLLSEGLVPTSRVLDVGCGALRVGYWLMHFLEPGCYHGIEPNKQTLDVGLREIVEPDTVQRAQARFSDDDSFDFSVLGDRFDFILARSIWTHASKPQIAAMLASFAATAAPQGVFLAAYHPASAALEALRRRPRLERRVAAREQLSRRLAGTPGYGRSADYGGEAWVGRSHESDEAGIVHHSLDWITGEASRHGLRATHVSHPLVNHQYWLRIVRA
jgi:SAM-dependent methyltransferase